MFYNTKIEPLFKITSKKRIENMFYNTFLDLGQFLGRKCKDIDMHCNKSETFWQKEDKLSQIKKAGYL